tara:strand:+ start:65535 stop:66686 length:1152 start_codon:yes stop_codon:yes gene_type:complete
MSEKAPAPSRIYLSPPDVRGREKELLIDALDSNWIAPLGPHVDAFEKDICDYVGVQHAAALSSGTAALHLALILLNVGPGDLVFVSSLTFVASANVIRYVGATPVFIDCNEETWNMCPAHLEQALGWADKAGQLPKAILSVDLYGHCADYDAISKLATRYEVPIIEDAAEALGADYRGRKAGRFGTMGIFSFNGNKIITTSGGGMLVSDNPEWVRRARHLATQARLPVAHYEHEEVGYNYRLSNLLAAVGRAQLETLDTRIACRQNVRDQYKEALSSVAGLRFMPEPAYGKSNAWLTCLLVDEAAYGASRDQLIQALADDNIEARPVWKPMHLQPVFADFKCFGGATSERLFNDGICLPSGSDLSPQDITRVTKIIRATGAAS